MSDPVVKLTILKDEDYEFPASRYAQQLRQAILDIAPPGTTIDRVPSDRDDMDLGETLLIPVITSALGSAVIEGLKAVILKRQRRVRVQCEILGKIVVLEGTEKEVAALLVEVQKLLAQLSASRE
jgi:hypothetical protein